MTIANTASLPFKAYLQPKHAALESNDTTIRHAQIGQERGNWSFSITLPLSLPIQVLREFLFKQGHLPVMANHLRSSKKDRSVT